MSKQIKTILLKQARSIFLVYLFCVLLATGIFYQYVFSIKARYEYVDFLSFFSAAKLLAQKPTQLYDMSSQIQYQLHVFQTASSPATFEYLPFVNHPLILLLYLPIILFTPAVAYTISMLFITGVGVLDMYLLQKLFPGRKPSIFFFALILFAPVFVTILHTQNSFFTLLLFIGIYYCLLKKKFFYAGVLSSVLLYKPQLLIVLFWYLLFLKNKNLYRGFILGALVMLGSAFILTRGSITSFIQLNHWYLVVYEAEQRNNINMVSLQGFFTQLTYWIPSLPARLLGLCFSVGMLVWVIKKCVSIPITSTHFPFVYSAIIVTTLLVGMHVHTHDVVLLLFPLSVYLWCERSYYVYVWGGLGWVVFFLTVFSSYSYYISTLYLLMTLGIIMTHIGKNKKKKEKLHTQ